MIDHRSKRPRRQRSVEASLASIAKAKPAWLIPHSNNSRDAKRPPSTNSPVTTVLHFNRAQEPPVRNL
jgi:hypothetical protein